MLVYIVFVVKTNKECQIFLAEILGNVYCVTRIERSLYCNGPALSAHTYFFQNVLTINCKHDPFWRRLHQERKFSMPPPSCSISTEARVAAPATLHKPAPPPACVAQIYCRCPELRPWPSERPCSIDSQLLKQRWPTIVAAVASICSKAVCSSGPGRWQTLVARATDTHSSGNRHLQQWWLAFEVKWSAAADLCSTGDRHLQLRR
jgi:hypothetical protein